MDSIVLLRCISWDERTEELVCQLSRSLGTKVLAVPDFTSIPVATHATEQDRFGTETLPITEEWIASSRLHLAHRGASTGWLCGDYVFYRALESEWERAWIVEPDVFFLNGAEKWLALWDELDFDLLAPNIGPAWGHWYWNKPWRMVRPSEEPFTMEFPLVRVSRPLAMKSLEVRREIRHLLTPEVSPYPNDEVVVASTAVSNGMSTFDLSKHYPQLFKYWATTAVANIDDLSHLDAPLIVHSGKVGEDYYQRLISYWDGAPLGLGERRKRFFASLSSANPETLRSLMERIWDHEH